MSSTSKPILKLDWCSHAAAKHAVENWHYSKLFPNGDTVKIGAWEDGRFVGAVVYARGATPNIGNPYHLRDIEACELVRVALGTHKVETSRILAISLKLLKKRCPGIRLVVSYADTEQGHHGGIYQAGGWVYVSSKVYHAYKVNGIITHPKTLHNRFGIGGQSIPWLKRNIDPNAERIRNGLKHKYLMPLDEKMREYIMPLAKPYPKRAASVDSGTPGLHPGRGGAGPTAALPENF